MLIAALEQDDIGESMSSITASASESKRARSRTLRHNARKARDSVSRSSAVFWSHGGRIELNDAADIRPARAGPGCGLPICGIRPRPESRSEDPLPKQRDGSPKPRAGGRD